MKTILLTGATGFLGHYLHNEFVNDYRIICIIRPNSKNLDRLTKVYADRINVVEHDFKNKLPDHIGSVDIILHLGGNPSAEHSIADPLSVIKDNVIGTANLLEFARTQKLERFVYYSSGEIFGPVPIGQDSLENHAYNSFSPYAASKAGGEELVMAYNKTFGIPASIVHINNTFGPRSQSNRLPVIIIKKLMNNQVIDLHTNSNNQIGGRRWFYAGDVAEQTRFILSNQTQNCEKWNFAGPKFISNLVLAKKIARHMGQQLKYNLVSIDRPGHDLCYSISPKKIYDLGWTPSKSFDDRLKETVKWYQENPDWLRR